MSLYGGGGSIGSSTCVGDGVSGLQHDMDDAGCLLPVTVREARGVCHEVEGGDEVCPYPFYQQNAKLTINYSVQPYSPPPRETLNILISQRTRLCPFCGAAVQKRSGCYGVICGQCRRAFPYDRARSLQMVHHEWVIETHQRNYALANRNDSRSWVGTQDLTG